MIAKEPAAEKKKAEAALQSDGIVFSFYSVAKVNGKRACESEKNNGYNDKNNAGGSFSCKYTIDSENYKAN